MNIEQVERLLDELSANMLADDEGTIPVFRCSDELIAHMNETETTDPTEARDSLNDLLLDHLARCGVWVPGKAS